MTDDLAALVSRLNAPRHTEVEPRFVAKLIETMRDAAAAIESLAARAERAEAERDEARRRYSEIDLFAQEKK